MSGEDDRGIVRDGEGCRSSGGGGRSDGGGSRFNGGSRGNKDGAAASTAEVAASAAGAAASTAGAAAMTAWKRHRQGQPRRETRTDGGDHGRPLCVTVGVRRLLALAGKEHWPLALAASCSWCSQRGGACRPPCCRAAVGVCGGRLLALAGTWRSPPGWSLGFWGVRARRPPAVSGEEVHEGGH